MIIIIIFIHIFLAFLLMITTVGPASASVTSPIVSSSTGRSRCCLGMAHALPVVGVTMLASLGNISWTVVEAVVVQALPATSHGRGVSVV